MGPFLKTYDEIMWSAVEDTLEEMYQHSYPKISWKQRMQELKEGKDVDKDLISHHYIPAQLYEEITKLAKTNYSYESFFRDYRDHFMDFLIKGGHARDIDNWGKDNYCDYSPIKEHMDENSYAILEKYIKAYANTFRFDWKRDSFMFSVMNYSPCICREKVIEYWKSQGVDLEIPSDEKIIAQYWGDDEDEEILTEDSSIVS